MFKNDLMELIEYVPQTGQVRAVPLLASPPWTNKYCVMDPAPGRSFLEWAVRHERTVFAISYRNLDPLMGGVTLHDYLGGPREALDVITTEITGAPKIDIIGLCLGGALTACWRRTSPRRATTGSAPSCCSTPCRTTASPACP